MTSRHLENGQHHRKKNQCSEATHEEQHGRLCDMAEMTELLLRFRRHERTKVLGNHVAEEKVHGMERKLRQGENFASVWETSGFCFPLLFELCQVGLSSGELPRFLNQAARLMTAETEEKLRRFRHIAEPVMLLFVGGLTALVLFSVMLPVFQMAGSHLAK